VAFKAANVGKGELERVVERMERERV